MKAYLDCIPCFLRQLLDGAQMIQANSAQKKKVVDQFLKMVLKSSEKKSPPEIACLAHRLLKKQAGDSDPYEKIKKKSNQLVLGLYGQLKEMVERSDRPLQKALELAIAGNIIDFGAKNNLNINEELGKILSEDPESAGQRFFSHFNDFKSALRNARTILYLADNSGEIVFDRLLTEEIRKKFPEIKIYFAVKEKPVINDALVEDALKCGLDKSTEIISNGTDAPGTLLSCCSKKFLKIYKDADVVISKGQGNFESLSEEIRPIFFLFMVKCPVVAKETGRKIGDRILFFKSGKGKQDQGF